MNAEPAGKHRNQGHIVQKAGIRQDFSLLQFMPLACGDDLGGIDGLFVELLLQNFSILAREEFYTARGFVFVNVDAILAGFFSYAVSRYAELPADFVELG